MTRSDTPAGNAQSQAPRIVTTLGDGRQIVHRDVSGLAAALIPPRPVPLRKRLFWSTLLRVLRTERGRRWVQRRYGA